MPARMWQGKCRASDGWNWTGSLSRGHAHTELGQLCAMVSVACSKISLMIIWVIQAGDYFNLVNNFLILGFVVTACFCLWAILGWHICDTAQWPGLGSSLKTNFVVDFLLLFSSWIVFQPVWFPNLVDCAAWQTSASRLCRGWKDKMVELSSWRRGGTDD